MVLIILISTHITAYHIGKIIVYKEYGKKLDMFREELNKIKELNKIL